MKLVPQKDQQIVILQNGYGETLSPPLDATVLDLLAIQFTAMTSDGRVYYFHYTDYKEKFDVLRNM